MADQERTVSIKVKAQTRALNTLRREVKQLERALKDVDNEKTTFEIEAIYDDLDEIDKIMNRVRKRGDEKMTMKVAVENLRDVAELNRLFERVQSARARVQIEVDAAHAKEQVDS